MARLSGEHPLGNTPGRTGPAGRVSGESFPGRTLLGEPPGRTLLKELSTEDPPGKIVLGGLSQEDSPEGGLFWENPLGRTFLGKILRGRPSWEHPPGNTLLGEPSWEDSWDEDPSGKTLLGEPSWDDRPGRIVRGRPSGGPTPWTLTGRLSWEHSQGKTHLEGLF